MVAYCGLSVLGDGICIIDILKATVHPVGIASLNELYDAAYWIIHECVMGDEVGGRAVNIGKVFGTDCLTFRLSSVSFRSAEMASSCTMYRYKGVGWNFVSWDVSTISL